MLRWRRSKKQSRFTAKEAIYETHNFPVAHRPAVCSMRADAGGGRGQTEGFERADRHGQAHRGGQNRRGAAGQSAVSRPDAGHVYPAAAERAGYDRRAGPCAHRRRVISADPRGAAHADGRGAVGALPLPVPQGYVLPVRASLQPRRAGARDTRPDARMDARGEG